MRAHKGQFRPELVRLLLEHKASLEDATTVHQLSYLLSSCSRLPWQAMWSEWAGSSHLVKAALGLTTLDFTARDRAGKVGTVLFHAPRFSVHTLCRLCL